jgi:hypothetical protein
VPVLDAAEHVHRAVLPAADECNDIHRCCGCRSQNGTHKREECEKGTNLPSGRPERDAQRSWLAGEKENPRRLTNRESASAETVFVRFTSFFEIDFDTQEQERGEGKTGGPGRTHTTLWCGGIQGGGVVDVELVSMMEFIEARKRRQTRDAKVVGRGVPAEMSLKTLCVFLVLGCTQGYFNHFTVSFPDDTTGEAASHAHRKSHSEGWPREKREKKRCGIVFNTLGWWPPCLRCRGRVQQSRHAMAPTRSAKFLFMYLTAKQPLISPCGAGAASTQIGCLSADFSGENRTLTSLEVVASDPDHACLPLNNSQISYEGMESLPSSPLAPPYSIPRNNPLFSALELWNQTPKRERDEGESCRVQGTKKIDFCWHHLPCISSAPCFPHEKL